MSAQVENTTGAFPQVSVVIPAYNCARYLSDTLASVFTQTFRSYEVILVNDGSPDTTEIEGIVGQFPGQLVYIPQEHRGASAARNTGTERARGEFVAYLDGDDLWLPNYLTDQKKFIDDHNCDLVSADAMMFGDTPNAGQSYMQWLNTVASPEGNVSFIDLVSSRINLITSGILVRRDAVIELGMFDESIRRAQDFDLWLRLARHGSRLMYQQKVLLMYRCHRDGLTGDAVNSIDRELRVLNRIDSCYDLSATERAQFMPVINNRRAALEFELGKHLLAQGDVDGAREAFLRTRRGGRLWKWRLALWLSRLAPNLLRAVYLRRLQQRRLT